MDASQFIKKILKEVKVELSEDFDRNFERQSFFTQAWQRQAPNGLKKTGRLRRSIRAAIDGNTIRFTSDAPYATIHNEGGDITVTARMKRFFWAKYLEITPKIAYKKSGDMTRRGIRLNADAEMYKALALMKVGSKIHMPERRFIGNAPEVKSAVERVVESNIQEYFNNELRTKFAKK